MEARKWALVEVNLSSVLLSLNAIFAKVISLNVDMIIFGRTFFAAGAFALYFLLLRKSVFLKERGDYVKMFFLGVLMAVHWLALFASVKMSTVAVAMVALATYPVMTILMEPFFLKKKIDWVDALMAGVVVFGVVCVVPEFDLSNDYTLGVLVGLLGAFAFALRNVLNNKFVRHCSPVTSMFYQIVVVLLLLLPVFVYQIGEVSVSVGDLWLLLLQGVFATVVGHTLFVSSIRFISPGSAGIIASVQPVYSVLLAYFILGEIPEHNVLIGAVMIFVVVVFENWRHARSSIVDEVLVE